MPAQHSIDSQQRIIVTKWTGAATDDSLLSALQTYQAEIQSDDRYLGFDEIVDFRDVRTIQISVKGLKMIGKTALMNDQRRPGTRVAFIVSTSLAVNLVKLYAMYRNFGQMPKKYIGAFKKEDDAYGWLRNKKKDNN